MNDKIKSNNYLKAEATGKTNSNKPNAGTVTSRNEKTNSIDLTNTASAANKKNMALNKNETEKQKSGQAKTVTFVDTEGSNKPSQEANEQSRKDKSNTI
jgi:hypothetical protein